MKKMTVTELEQEWSNLRSQSRVAIYVDVNDPDGGVLVKEVCACPAEAGGYVAKLLREGYKHVEAVVQ